MDSKKVLEALQEELTRERGGPRDEDGAAVALLRGQNPASAKALLDQELIIRYFPFHVGRMGNHRHASPQEPDLSLEDQRPFHLSRLHLILERRGKEIVLVDPGSRTGSLIDQAQLGKRRGGVREIALSPGRHKIRLGGADSPFLFTLDVLNDREAFGVSEQVRFGDRTVPVSALYSRLHQHTKRIFRRFFLDRPEGLQMATELVESLLQHREAIDPLYYFSAVPETYDDVIVTHSLNVVIYTLKFAKTSPLPLPADDLRRLALAALFHDIGMYDIPPEVVHKRTLITAEEYEVIKRHPLQGQTWLRDLGRTEDLLPAIALTHHERIDGHGYPRGIKDPSPYTELIAMVDFFEALTHYRPQRGPVTPHEGIRRLIDLKRAIFSPAMLKQFIKGFSLYPVYSVVRLNSGEIGQVVSTNPDWPLRPIVRICFDRNGRAEPAEKKIDLANLNHCYITRDISDRVFVDRCFKL